MSGKTIERDSRIIGAVFLLIAALTPSAGFADADALPLHVADSIPAAKLANAERQRSHGPLRFATATPVAVDMDGGVWESAGADSMRWRTRITSPGAHSLSLRLAYFRGAPDAQLWLRSPETGMTQGPYDINDVDRQGQLWTALVFDDTVVVDVLVPAAQQPMLELRIDQAHHGYRDLRKQLGPNASDSCNIDVACAQGNDWRDQARSVAGLVVAGTGFCTGNLLNNTAQDGDPLVVTGHHCDFRANNADSLVAYWNFQADQCNGAPMNFDQSQSGAEFVATHEASDHTLLRLDELPDEAFGVFYSGWDANPDVTVDSGVSIHHPQADVKKISLFNSPATKSIKTIPDAATGEEQTSEVWEVIWDQGTTERGSSGGGLWNADEKLVGVLFGGSASCSEPNGEDFYGRLEVAWEGGGSSESHMKSCLDKTASGMRKLDGIDASDLSPPGEQGAELQDCQVIGDSGGSFWAPLLALAALLRRRRVRQSIAD